MGKEDVCGDLTPALSTATRIACPRQAAPSHRLTRWNAMPGSDAHELRSHVEFEPSGVRWRR
jgi:hypothetical protein